MANINDMRKAVGKPVQSAPAQKTPMDNVISAITSEGFKKQMALALPKTLTAERMTRIVLTEIRKVPALAQCDLPSLMGAVMQAAQLGLEPGSALGHCYLLPFGNGKSRNGQPNAQLIIGYRGMLDLARRSGQIQSFSAFTVRQGDDFNYQLGLKPDIHHIPSDAADRDSQPVTHVYAVANLKDGGVQFEVMSRAAIEAVRLQSKAAKSGPWVTHWEEMAKKTVLRRLFKYLPISIEAARAIQVDENTDNGIAMNYIQGAVVDITPAESNETEALPEPETPTAGAPAAGATVSKMETVDPETGEVLEGTTMTFSFDQIADMLNKAENPDMLDIAMDNIRYIKNDVQQQELYKLAEQKSEAYK